LKGITQFLTALMIIAAVSAPAFAQEPGSSPSAPVHAGTTITGIIECGEGYTSHELYDMKLTLVEVIRGEEAWKRIRETDASNKPPESGTEYLLARVRYEYYARGVPGLCIHQLGPDQFTAYSASGEDYKTASVRPPKPELRKALKSGESFEGWMVFAVSKEDKAPLLYYSADDGGAVQHGGGKWLLLSSK
jgi:hypothetical protein